MTITDCVVGGSPCQNFSVAGNQEGLDGDQSVLFVEQLRVIKEMRDRDVRSGRTGEFIRPRFMVWENVPGAFSTNKGQDFQKVLEETAKVIDKDAVIPMPPKNKWTTSGCIMGDGWSIAWRILDAQFWGVPQRRRRIALVADFGGQCAPEILFVRKSLRRNSEASRTERQGVSADAQGCIGVHDRDGKAFGFPLGFRPENVRCYEEKATTLCVGTRAGFCNGLIFDARGNGDGKVCCTLTGDHQNRVTDYTSVVCEPVNDSNYLDVEMEVAVRKYEVDCNLLSECLREHKESLKLSNKHIAESLDRPITEVEHWFRNDIYFSIPSPDVWYDLKELLGIETEEFDKSIMVFEFRGCDFDMRNRIYTGNTSPTLKTDCGNSLYLVPERVEGLDCYNQQVTGDKSKSLTNSATDSDHIPCVVMDRSAYNQGVNAKIKLGIDENGIAFSHIAKGPGAVCYIDTSHADDVVRTDDVVAPLQARDYKGGKYIFCVDQGGGKSGANVTENLAPTLTCTHGGEPVICLQGNGIDRADTAGCNGKGWKEGTCYTLNTVDRPAVVYNGENITSPLNKTNPQPGDPCHTLTSDNRNYLVESKPHYIVRRLTPMECERLQGFPDGWTDIGEYIDSKGKKKKTSDSARYKALGNSIALPQWKWIIKRLCSHYERDVTLASLFDGIGGFPHLWEQINGKGSCLWASEIEDFPIAVTKARIE